MYSVLAGPAGELQDALTGGEAGVEPLPDGTPEQRA
jgi:hypothetical protein